MTQTRPTTVSPIRALIRAAGRLSLAAVLAVPLAHVPTFDADARPAKKARKAVHKPRTALPKSVRLATRAPIEIEPATGNRDTPVLTRDAILATDAGRLARIGQHVMIGYHSYPAVKALVEKKAIAGVFITDHNVRGRRAADVKADIDALQAIRKEQGLPPLIIAADQEGGQVSRLSPPLKRQPSLARILKTLDNDEARRAAVEDYAETQAAELKRIGVTLNFAPVVDLNLDPKNRSDGETHLRLRAIAADPYLVSKVASWYCDVFAKHGLMCTLKHFPGLGRVKRDTHRVSGEVAASEGQLELNDWVPFRRVMSKSNVATMLGHVRVAVIDKTTPASFSHTIISTLIRDTWKHDGLLITDDLSMGAVTRSKAGVGGAAVKALDAGADIVLVSFSEKHLDTVMSALIAADAKGEIDSEARGKSETRLARILKENISSD